MEEAGIECIAPLLLYDPLLLIIVLYRKSLRALMIEMKKPLENGYYGAQLDLGYFMPLYVLLLPMVPAG